MEMNSVANQSSTDTINFWVIRIVPAVAILVVIIVIAFLLCRCYRKKKTDSSKRTESDDDTPLDRFPPSRSKRRYKQISSSSSSSSASEGYGSLQSHSLLLGRHASSVHELTPVDNIHYLDISSDSDSSPGHLGQVLVSLSYSQSKRLTVTILEVTNLTLRPFTESIDPFVRIRVMSSKEYNFRDFQFQTSVKRKTQNPVFEETFHVDLSEEELKHHSIQLVVVNYQKFSRKDVIGEIFIPLYEVTSSNEITRSYDLSAPQTKCCGEILLSLSYLPTSNRLLLGILQARNLTGADDSRHIDPCVRASLIMGGRKCRKKKTGVIEADNNPVFNEKFFFEIPVEKLDRIQVLVAVTNEREIGQDSDTDTGYNDAEVGQVILGYRSTPRAHAHWLKMMDNPREKYAQWYDLTSLVTP